MSGGGGLRAIARASLVRVFAVLALVVGVALLQSTLSERGIAWTPQCATAAVQVFVDAPVEGASVPLDGLGGVPEACLAVLLVVLLAVAGARRPGQVVVGAVREPPRWRSQDRRPGVRLTLLCVSRT